MSRLITIVILALSVACAGPMSEAQGTLEGEVISIIDANPELKFRPANQDVTIVIAQDEADILTTISITIPGGFPLLVGVPMSLSKDGLRAQVSRGETVREDGFVSTKDTVFYEVSEGELTLDSLSEPVAGTFSMTLDEGDLDGSFVIAGDLLQAEEGIAL